jgi:hypothetical protein
MIPAPLLAVPVEQHTKNVPVPPPFPAENMKKQRSFWARPAAPMNRADELERGRKTRAQSDDSYTD